MRRYKTSLSNTQLFTGDMGYVYPIGHFEVLPTDGIQHQTSIFLRMAPMLKPIMHPVQVHVKHYYVPNRILWDGWEDFITGGPDGTDTSVPPSLSHSATPANEPLLHYLGIPDVASYTVKNALAVRAYNAIINADFLDDDLQTERDLDDMTLARVNWAKDYFTTMRPWPQKGPAITIPLDGVGLVDNLLYPTGESFDSLNGARYTKDSSLYGGTYTSDGNYMFLVGDDFANNRPMVDGSSYSFQLNEFRRAAALMSIQEARAKWGSDYVDYLRYLGVTPRDSRHRRPEYLAGGQRMIATSEVLQTAEGTNPVGSLYGHGITQLKGNRYRMNFAPEHGFIMTLMFVRPKAVYMDGVHRSFLRTSKEDYYQQELEAIGQQEVYNSELYIDGSATDDEVAGYSNRNQEYTELPSMVHGEFRTTANEWHLARDFTSRPALNSTFIECHPSKRIYAVPAAHGLQWLAHHSIQARRKPRRNVKPRIV